MLCLQWDLMIRFGELRKLNLDKVHNQCSTRESIDKFYRRCSDKIITGSFDKTAKIWNAGTGGCVHTLHGHTAEVVAAEFGSAGSVASERAATASMDGTARVFDSTTGQPTHCLDAHGAEVIAARFSRDGQQVLTGSFDNTALVWDLRSGKLVGNFLVVFFRSA